MSDTEDIEGALEWVRDTRQAYDHATRALHGAAVQAVRDGAPKTDVAAAAGIGRSTLDRWLAPTGRVNVAEEINRGIDTLVKNTGDTQLARRVWDVGNNTTTATTVRNAAEQADLSINDSDTVELTLRIIDKAERYHRKEGVWPETVLI